MNIEHVHFDLHGLISRDVFVSKMRVRSAARPVLAAKATVCVTISQVSVENESVELSSRLSRAQHSLEHPRYHPFGSLILLS